jgi:phosphoribosylformylglycinamidine cyclo-ligase
MSLTYRDAGVDLEAAEAVTAGIRERLGSALFGGFVPVPALKSYTLPVLVSSIDGVGSKVRLAALLDRVEGLGEDIVHHCVNDIAVHGASPLFFLDYLASHRIEPALIERIVSGIAATCERLGIVLAGGETAEMPSVYPPGRFDVAGAVVGVVEQAAILDGASIQPGDFLIGVPSSGLHTNGYSLAQRLFRDEEYGEFVPALGETLGEALLAPHRCYVKTIGALMATGAIRGMAHITGGGIAGNLSRIMPAGTSAVVELPPAPPLFDYLQSRGVPRDEMLRVFNMGIGLIAVCGSTTASHLPAECRLIGHVESGTRRVVIRDER